ncbi:MAG TPA: isoprenyl transferase [Acidobacteriota bacterium]|nr:isoprenyl transferase [Acidobacteriota bacterium]
MTKAPAADELLRLINLERLPAHVAVIMDGNGRWAKRRSLPRVSGHREGIKSVKEIVETSARLGLKVLTLYAFSVENWKRPVSEVNTLMRLLREYIHKELKTLQKNNIRFNVIGRWKELAPAVVKDLVWGMKETTRNTGLLFNIALNYGGRTEIVDAVRAIVTEFSRGGRIRDPEEITEETVSNHLYTSGQPDPDLLIRTSGELRISNYLLWQIAYAEIWVTDVLWPDFRKQHLYQAIIDYQKRERRYGGITKTVGYTGTE